MPRARSQPLNLAFHHWAAIAVQRDGHFKAHCDALRAKGHSHARTLRGVMDRVLRRALPVGRRGSSRPAPARDRSRAVSCARSSAPSIYGRTFPRLDLRQHGAQRTLGDFGVMDNLGTQPVSV